MARAPSQSIQKAELAGRMRVGEPGFVLQSPAPSHPNIKRRESGESSQIKAWRCLPWRPEQLRVLICIPSGAGAREPRLSPSCLPPPAAFDLV